MLWPPLTGEWRNNDHNYGTGSAASFGTSITTGAAAATKGTAVQLIASTAYDSFLMEIIAAEYGAAGRNSNCCLDILLGAATEHVLIPNLLAGYCGGSTSSSLQTGPKRWLVPIYVPAGSRISAQAAGNATSTAMRVGVRMIGGVNAPGFPCGTKVTTYGIGTVPNGTAITPGVSNAEGAWTQITASTTEKHIALFDSFQVNADTSTTNSLLAVDMGYGAATEEEVLGQEFFLLNSNETMVDFGIRWPIFKNIPSSSRLVMRASNSIATNDSGYHGAIHAVS